MRALLLFHAPLLASLGLLAQERAIDKEAVVAAPREAVWQAWTSKAGIESFFAPEAEIEPRVGGAFHIHFDPLAEPGLKGADDMRFMALQPPAMLSFDWSAPPLLPQARQQRTFMAVGGKYLQQQTIFHEQRQYSKILERQTLCKLSCQMSF